MPFCEKCGTKVDGQFCPNCGELFIKPCSVCGSAAEMIETYKDRSGFYCKCGTCNLSTDEYISPAEAVSVWNAGSPETLKDENQRIIRAIVVHPYGTFWQLFWRLFLTTFISFFSLLTAISGYRMSGDATVFEVWAVFTVISLSIGLPLYILYAVRRNRLIKRLPPADRAANEKAKRIFAIVFPCFYLSIFLLFLPVLLFPPMPTPSAVSLFCAFCRLEIYIDTVTRCFGNPAKISSIQEVAHGQERHRIRGTVEMINTFHETLNIL